MKTRPKISVVINYCSNDKKFLRECLNAARQISNQIIVPVSDHFFDGTPEDMELIEQHATDFYFADFLVFRWQEKRIPSRYWHNYARLLGAQKVKDNCDWVLFLDVDEIVEPDLFNKFAIACLNNPHINSYKLANYWYFRERKHRAKQIEDSAVIVRSDKSCDIDLSNFNQEREQFEYYNTPRKVTIDNKPIIHHYSWVRTKEEMLKKVKAWGHNMDKDWVFLVEEEFSRPFNGRCFVNNYEFE